MATSPISRTHRRYQQSIDDPKAYRSCHCDKFCLSITSFRQWAKERGYEASDLREMDLANYLYLWGVYEGYATVLRGNKGTE